MESCAVSLDARGLMPFASLPNRPQQHKKHAGRAYRDANPAHSGCIVQPFEE
jgi:hypothetical protein